MQVFIIINDVKVPIILEGRERWYPISYIFDRAIKFSSNPSKIMAIEEMKQYIKIINVDFNFNKAGNQNTYCINGEGIKVYFSNYIKIGKISIEKRKLINGLLKYIKADLLSEDEQFIKSYEYKGKYNCFIEDCIREILKENPNIIWQKCNKCNNYYPNHKNFFKENQRSTNGLNVQCRDCQKWDENRSKIHIKHPNKSLNNIYYKYGEKIFLIYINHDIIEIYKHYEKEKLKLIPTLINNKNDLLIIIKWLYKNKRLNIEQLNEKDLREKYNIRMNTLRLTQREIYTFLFDNDWILRPWKYPNINLPYVTIEEYKIMFSNYLNEYNIAIDNVYTYDYKKLFKDMGIYCHIDNLLSFVMSMYNDKYGAYKFNIRGENYWKPEEHRIQALKYLIEEDMKIEIDKIPLYITKMCLQRNARTLYTILYSKKYYNNLFEWVNKCYPNKFVEADFVINPYRDEFDSQDEIDINNVLHEYFNGNVLYNQRNTDRTIKINNMIPDWIVFTDKDCILIEYFGLWIDRENLPKRNAEYVEKTKKKINKYKELDNYLFIDLYPKDLENNFMGIKNKLMNI